MCFVVPGFRADSALEVRVPETTPSSNRRYEYANGGAEQKILIARSKVAAAIARRVSFVHNINGL